MLRSRIEQALREAMLKREEKAVSTLRLIVAALKDRDIAERGKGNPNGLNEQQIQELLQSMIKQRRESIAAYEKGGRLDLAGEEAEEIATIQDFLPQPLSEQETTEAVTAAVQEMEAKSLKDMGRVMAALKARYKGRMDFAKAGALVKERLS